MTDTDPASPVQAPAGSTTSPERPVTWRSVFRHWRWALVGVCAVICAVSVGANLWHWFGPPAWSPRLTCTERAFNFGERGSDETVAHTFVLANTGREPLEIRGLQSSCGCMTAKVSQLQLAPGERVEVPIEIALKGLQGKIQKSILVRSNDPKRPNLVLTVTGTVR
jgi:hypothetical protein